MAKTKKINPTIIVDGVSREMTDEEFSDYSKVNLEAQNVVDLEKKKVLDKELATAKFLALGLTEEDLKMMGL